MNYLRRDLEQKFLRMSAFFKAVLITGARQVGKTTMLRRLAKEQNRTYVSLDNHLERELAKSDPVVFFQTYKPPVIIDEVQYAPELFSRIKIICDGSGETGLFWLTGSQQYNMMQNVRETLAGRIGVMELYSLTRHEKDGVIFTEDLDFTLPNLLNRQARVPQNNIVDIFEHIWRGGMPQLIEADAEQRLAYFNSYIDSYLMRDVAEFGGITDALRFGKFLTACAALIAQPVSYKTLADTAEISQPTAKEWLRLLEGMGIVYLLQPYYNNALKRLAKTPKLYFCDTGLAAFLSMWITRDTLMNGAASGHFFENYAVMEMVKGFAYSKGKARMSYYRDANGKEIDLFIERDNTVHPFEIKKSANPDRREIKKFNVLDKLSVEQGSGGIICMCEETVPIDGKNFYIPCNIL
ncbi:MAG: ATP-binding protein, partial [Clostridiales bacterium]|nr:ATP-binding protein [Clostridiales bacterium]